MDTLHFPVTVDEYVTFHAMDRALYSALAIDLWRDPFESVYVLSLWIWIEQHGFNNFISYLLSLESYILNKFADEAVKCLRGINDVQFVFQDEDGGIPVVPQTYKLLKDKISPQYFLENQTSIVREIMIIVAQVCSKTFPDLVQDAYNKHAAYNSWATDLASLGFVGETNLDFAGETNLDTMSSKEDRTMFVTFSRGFPVTEEEVRMVFTTFFGDCIESFHMQPVNPYEQPLYARIVLSSSLIVNHILNTETKAKFAVNGKHIWVRKFVAKHRTFP